MTFVRYTDGSTKFSPEKLVPCYFITEVPRLCPKPSLPSFDTSGLSVMKGLLAPLAPTVDLFRARKVELIGEANLVAGIEP